MNNVAHNIDCMAAMAAMPDKAFELAIVDPPYGINAAAMNMGDGYYGKGRKDRVQIKPSEWDRQAPTEDYFAELMRVSANQIIWGGNYFYLPPSRGIVCWDKMQPWPNFSAWEMAWTSFDVPAKMCQFNNATFLTAGKIHPTQKPVALYKWLLTNYAKPGWKILDTHLGSGSSRIAAYDLGFEFTGYELDKDYFEAQEERFARHVAQGSLFVPEASTPEQVGMFSDKG